MENVNSFGYHGCDTRMKRLWRRLMLAGFATGLMIMAGCGDQQEVEKHPPKKVPAEEKQQPAYSQKDYRIFREHMDAPIHTSEEFIFRQLAERHNTTPDEIKLIVDRVVETIDTDNEEQNARREDKLCKHLSGHIDIVRLQVMGEFATVEYLHPELKDDSTEAIVAQMPELLERGFQIQGIDRIRLLALAGREQAPVAIVEAYRYEFEPGKPASAYHDFHR